jgi:DNA-binding transcriptional regulator YhcF (GntR family)
VNVPDRLYLKAAAIVRAGIEDGTFAPGQPVPSGAQLAKRVGCSQITARKGLRTLVAQGVLEQGVTQNARHRVPSAGPERNPDIAGRALSRALASARKAAGLTQPQLAAKAAVSVTTIGHAETGRLWQSPRIWRDADDALGARGELVQLHAAYQAARQGRPAPGTAAETLTADDSAAPHPVHVITVWSDGAVTHEQPCDPPPVMSRTSKTSSARPCC